MYLAEAQSDNKKPVQGGGTDYVWNSCSQRSSSSNIAITRPQVGNRRVRVFIYDTDANIGTYVTLSANLTITATTAQI